MVDFEKDQARVVVVVVVVAFHDPGDSSIDAGVCFVLHFGGASTQDIFFFFFLFSLILVHLARCG